MPKSQQVFSKNYKLIIKFIWKCKWPRRAKVVFLKSQAGELTLPDFKTHYKSYSNYVWVWQKDSVLTIFSYFLYSWCSGIWCLADPGETAPPRASYFLEAVNDFPVTIPFICKPTNPEPISTNYLLHHDLTGWATSPMPKSPQGWVPGN